MRSRSRTDDERRERKERKQLLSSAGCCVFAVELVTL